MLLLLFLACTVTQPRHNKKNYLKTIQWMKSRKCDVTGDSKFYVCAFTQNSDIRRNILYKFTEPSIPTWRSENSVNIWNLLWLSRGLIICTEQASTYKSTFPNTLTSE